MAVGFSSISGTILLHGYELFNHLWNNLSCMAVGFATISGTTYPAWLSAFKHLWDIQYWMAVSFSIISGTSHPAWLWAFQPLLEQPFLNGCDMAVNFSNISGILILHGCQLFQHLCTSYPAWLLASQPSLEQPSTFGASLWNSYPAWLWAFQPALEQPILHGNQLSSISAFQSSLVHPTLHDCKLSNHRWSNLEPSKHAWTHVWSILSWMAVTWLWTFQTSLEYLHLWDIQSWMAVSFSIIFGTSHPAWLWAFQPLLEQPWTFEACLEACLKHPILNGCDMAVNFSNISGILILHGCQLFNDLLRPYPTHIKGGSHPSALRLLL